MAARILTAERLHRDGRREGAAYFARRWGTGPIPALDEKSGRTVVAFISWGRWLVVCPSCSSAQPAWEEDRRFLCAECGNLGAGWHDVRWPVNAEAIEAVLVLRPHAATRNWQPGEPLDALRADNIAHGLDPGRPDPAIMQSALGLLRTP